MAFASLVLSLLDIESKGFHFRGNSSSGKSTILKVSASVFGNKDYVHSWNSTINGLESIAVCHNHTLLILDELGQVDPKQAGETAYMLGNGKGKQRANKTLSHQECFQWKVLFMSSGEIDLGSHMSTSGKQSTAGQEVRLIDIPADAGMNLGCFENLHGFENGAIFSDELVERAEKYYGIASRVFIQNLLSCKHPLKERFKIFKHDFLDQYVPDGADGQIIRTANYFALVGFGGILATELGLTGWKEEDVLWSVEKCFKAWLNARGGIESIESMRMLAHTQRFFEMNRGSFERLKSNDKVLGQRLGFIKISAMDNDSGSLEIEEYLITSEIFRSEFCKGFDFGLMTKFLVAKNIIILESEKVISQSRKLNELSKQRCYVFSAKALRELEI